MTSTDAVKFVLSEIYYWENKYPMDKAFEGLLKLMESYYQTHYNQWPFWLETIPDVLNNRKYSEQLLMPAHVLPIK